MNHNKAFENNTLCETLHRVTVDNVTWYRPATSDDRLKATKKLFMTKIDVRSSLGGFYISECVCPSLAIFRSSYFVKDNRWNGVRPVARICVQEELEKNYAQDKRIIDLQVSSNPFHGMHVPETCIVRTFLQKKNYS